MKKIILSVLAVMAFGSVNAQLREKGTFEIIPQIGSSSANYYSGEAGSGNKSLSDVTFGIGGEYFFNDSWSLHSGLFFQTMGTKFSGDYDKLK